MRSRSCRFYIILNSLDPVQHFSKNGSGSDFFQIRIFIRGHWSIIFFRKNVVRLLIKRGVDGLGGTFFSVLPRVYMCHSAGGDTDDKENEKEKRHFHFPTCL